MLNTISKYSQSLRILIYSSIFVIIIKCNFKFSSKLNSIGIDQDPMIAALLVRSLGSNHPRRINIIITTIRNIKYKLFEKIKILFPKKNI